MYADPAAGPAGRHAAIAQGGEEDRRGRRQVSGSWGSLSRLREDPKVLNTTVGQMYERPTAQPTRGSGGVLR